MYLNKTQIIGNLTRDPELKALPSGVMVASFSIATNRVWKDKNGAKQESVEYHNCVAFGRTAELIAQYMSKGSQLYVEGRLQTQSWEDKKSGEKKYRTEIVVEQMQFGNNKPKDGGSTSAPRKAQKPQQSEADKQWDDVSDDGGDIDASDIPF